MAAAIPEITTLFYDKLFADHPELLSDLFNRGNQATGEQQRALAGSIARFATLVVDHPDQPPASVLGRIAHKHASLGVTAEQYDVVQFYLFYAIAEVLGGAVTADVAAAWDELYWLMAHTLIDMEAELYREAQQEPGQNWRPWLVIARHEETDDVASFLLRPADGGDPPPFLPGQYVSVAVTLPDGARQIRQYSFSNAPQRPIRRISVKRVCGGPGPDGEVSTWLHANVNVGDTLSLSAPCGNAVADMGHSPLLLVSAGIGCTPVIGILDYLVASGTIRPVIVVHADRSLPDHAMRQHLERSVKELPNARAHVWYEQPPAGWPTRYTGIADLDGLDIPEDAQAYVCGPAPFIQSITQQLTSKGVPRTAIRHELFGPELAA